MSASLGPVDHAALKANQLVIIALSAAAFIFDVPLLALFVGIVMSLGTFFGKPGFLKVYSSILRPLGLIRPDIFQDNPEPHRFAQGFGAVVLLGASAALFAGLHALGWALLWLVIVLASLNAFAGFCAGCFVYYQLARLGAPGFAKRPPEGTFPGFKPKAHHEADA
ncbi:MAG: DUF4395 domain-containing protein [Spirochaetae bacterium HGW-Spirochaetae-7]|jgi:hypothetical protein|nr:MAG: DUF4395 domain-containing protein [Spirochaetae bacterium HGW-Spirochaetae-7]